MESIEGSGSGSNKNFIKHVFNFDNDSKSEILNIIQYALLAIIPIVLLNKSMSKYVPEADDKKSSMEVVAEILIQIIFMFMGILLVHRMITFVPTYSGMKYPDYNVIFSILAILMITMSLQTKLGEKVNILVERIVDLWEGNTDDKKKKKKKQSGQQGQQQQTGQIIMPRVNQEAMTSMNSGYSDGTAIGSLPTSSGDGSTTNYDNMYRKDNNPLVNAATPGGGVEGFMEPMAANSVLGGGGAFGSW